jgi:hypothetical protein
VTGIVSWDRAGCIGPRYRPVRAMVALQGLPGRQPSRRGKSSTRLQGR